jgi:hypothetical protein
MNAPKYRLQRDHQFHLSTDGKNTLCGLSGDKFIVYSSNHSGPCTCRRCKMQLGRSIINGEYDGKESGKDGGI